MQKLKLATTLFAAIAIAAAGCASDRVELFPDGMDAATPPSMDAMNMDAEPIDSGVHRDAAAPDAEAEDARAPDAETRDAEAEDAAPVCACRFLGCSGTECQTEIFRTSVCERGTCTGSNGICAAGRPCVNPLLTCVVDETSIEPCR